MNITENREERTQQLLRALRNNIPDELRAVPQWMGTRFEPRRGKPDELDKPPYRVKAGMGVIKAGKDDPGNYATFEEAAAALERGAVDAIGFVVTDGDPFWFGDHDKVIDLETGEISEDAVEVVHALNTYTEYSVSGRGLRTVAIGEKPAGARCVSDKLGYRLELYDGRSQQEGKSGTTFLVMTGRRFGYTSPNVEHRQGELEALCRKLWAGDERPKTSQAAPDYEIPFSDHELLNRIRRARKGVGKQFRRLYDHGDIEAHDGNDRSPSGADFALVKMLVWWCAGDRERIIRLFESSVLYRKPPEKDRGYVSRTVDKALDTHVGDYYRPRSVRKARREERDDPLAPYLNLLLDPSLWTGRRAASGYKAYAAAVALAAEHGVADDAGNLRIGCDVRRLAETAGCRLDTISSSALPYLIQEKKLIRWRRGKGTRAGELVLLRPEASLTRNTRINTRIGITHGDFSVPVWGNAQEALDTLRLLIRMRSGRSKHATYARLGMVPMFLGIAMCAARACVYTAKELASATGRRIDHVRKALTKLKSAGVVREKDPGCYGLSERFREEWERELKESGIVHSEEQQRVRHQRDREERDRRLRAKREGKSLSEEIRRSDAKMRGKERVAADIRRNHAAPLRRWINQRAKAGQDVPRSVYLLEELLTDGYLLEPQTRVEVHDHKVGAHAVTWGAGVHISPDPAEGGLAGRVETHRLDLMAAACVLRPPPKPEWLPRLIRGAAQQGNDSARVALARNLVSFVGMDAAPADLSRIEAVIQAALECAP